MGFVTEFNWVLKLSPEQGLDEKKLGQGKSYGFSKDGYRVYPVDMPIDLLNNDREAVARVVVKECANSEGKTTGKYEVLRVYEGKEKQMLSRYWQKK
jgi:hypothetical protein